MNNKTLSEAIAHWGHVAPLVAYPKNKKEFDKLVANLDELLDIVENNENHPLIGLIDVISNLISSYEEEHYRKSAGSALDALKFLMAAHNLHQSNLPEVASQGVLSEILNGKRSLNLRQIKMLAERFNVDPSTFIDI